MKRARVVGAAVVVVVAAPFLLGALLFDALIEKLPAPAGPFDPSARPAPPDYGDDAAWSARPARDDAGDAAVPALPAGDQTRAVADVFYVHPTTYVGSAWNAPVDDARLNADTDRVATRLQATAFNDGYAVWAPRYRQANGTSYARAATPDARASLDVAYRDVRAAFASFLARRPPGPRGFVLAGHSQGSAHAARLLAEVIAPDPPLRALFVAAFLPGAAIARDFLARAGVPACEDERSVGCVVAYHARTATYAPSSYEPLHLDDGVAVPAATRVCVNPISGRVDGGPAAASSVAVFLDVEPPRLLPSYARAECRDGTLRVALASPPPRDFMSRVLDRALGAGNHHAVEYQLFWGDLRRAAGAKHAAWTAGR